MKKKTENNEDENSFINPIAIRKDKIYKDKFALKNMNSVRHILEDS